VWGVGIEEALVRECIFVVGGEVVRPVFLFHRKFGRLS
jgi:hypothetical protein